MSANAGITNDLVWPNYSKENLDRVKPTGAEKTMGKDAFLKILITQLSNQDPMSPMEDKDFIAQMAQFTSLEQLMGISEQLNMMQQTIGMSSTLIGKEVTWMQMDDPTGEGDTGNTALLYGTVDSIIMRAGVPYAKVGDYEIDMKDITEIREPGTSNESGDGNGEDNNSSEQEGVLS
ncbi:flagellar hook capping FlgD N-terminal domain-containing protein [Paenibacillus marinisediminis]